MRSLITLLLLASASTAVVAAPAPSGSLFGKKTGDATPEKRVEYLLMTAQTATDAYKRADAVEELRNYSTTTFPQIVPVLVDILHQDKNSTVRAEAARSLGRLRPLTKMAGDALSEAASKDAALRVRWQARTSLTVFTVAGWKSGNHGPNELDPGKGKIVVDKHVDNIEGQVLVPPPDGQKLPNYPLPMPKGPSQTQSLKPMPQPLPAPLPPAANVPTETPLPAPLPNAPSPSVPPAPSGSLVPVAPPAASVPPPAAPVFVPDVGPLPPGN